MLTTQQTQPATFRSDIYLNNNYYDVTWIFNAPNVSTIAVIDLSVGRPAMLSIVERRQLYRLLERRTKQIQSVIS